MEQAQLFKRLLDITDDEISSFIKHDEEVNKGLMRLDLAAMVLTLYSSTAGMFKLPIVSP